MRPFRQCGRLAAERLTRVSRLWVAAPCRGEIPVDLFDLRYMWQIFQSRKSDLRYMWQFSLDDRFWRVSFAPP